MAEAPGSRTQPPRASGGRPVLKTGRATGPRSLPGQGQPSSREGRNVGVRSATDHSHKSRPEAARRNSRAATDQYLGGGAGSVSGPDDSRQHRSGKGGDGADKC